MKLLVLKEKHGERHFAYNTKADLNLIARFIVSERIEAGYYEDEQNKLVLALLNEVVLRDDGKAAWNVLQARSRHEYEDYDQFETQSVPGVPA